ncbi:MAG: tRNA 4-thiouridine(8) synthase ThiI [bacterium]
MEKLAVGLYSGGLDSILAVKLIVDQGFRVILVKFTGPIFEDRQPETGILDGILPAESFSLREVTLGADFLQVIQSPEYGYGKNLNPCLDCKIFMVKKAGEILKECAGAFVFTGEVLGQRPMSQRRDALRIIERDSGLTRYLLRPLSARLLPPTQAEEQGLVRRDALLDISGRSRKRQMELAREFGIFNYPSPAGGCLLTDESFSRRLKATLARKDDRVRLEDMPLLKLGRHFLIRPGVRLIVGRNHAENQKILALANADNWLFRVMNAPGPISLALGNLEEADFQLAASITARYSDAKVRDAIQVSYAPGGNDRHSVLTVSPVEDHLLEHYRI